MPIELIGLFILLLISRGLYLVARAVRSAPLEDGSRPQADRCKHLFDW